MANYYNEITKNNNILLRQKLSELPKFLSSFFRAIEPTTSARTRIAYAYDLGVFFNYIKNSNPIFRDIEIQDISLDDIDKISPVDIEEFMDFLKIYTKSGKEFSNSKSGQMRKLATLRSFYNYYYRKEYIKNNPAQFVQMPKLNDKTIIRLDNEEIIKLIECIENGIGLTDKQLIYHNKTKIRDLALITLLLGTGIRVSECVGLNLSDVDLENDAIKVTRKGGDEARIYFSYEVHNRLVDYLEERKNILGDKGSELAFFLSSQKKRLSVRSVENLVKKYAQIAAPLKKITPHKLRSTYGTQLYHQTGDIYLVADILGHKDVNTTRKHYSDQNEIRRRQAGRNFKLTDE